jgi:predicted esterase/SAM-dependent methyltransferase
VKPVARAPSDAPSQRSPARAGGASAQPAREARALEEQLARKVFTINLTAAHDRPLRGVYSYEAILGIDLVELCTRLQEQKPGVVRVLDIGCGSGLALHQLQAALAERGLGERFEFFGMGLNWYQRMHVSPTHFLMSGLFHFHRRGPPFDLVISVFAFHYLWHKLEGLEKVHNELLADEGVAVIHFPGFLAQVADAGTGPLDEERGNQAFARFLADFGLRPSSPNIEYAQVPYYSDDDDRAVLAEFGRLRFSRAPGARLDFGLALAEFGVVPANYGFEYAGVTSPEYVLSRYAPRAPEPAAAPAPIGIDAHGLKRARVSVAAIDPARPALELVVHPLLSKTVIVLVPGAREGLDDSALPFPFIANNVQEAGLAAAVRCNNPLQEQGGTTELLRDHFGRLMEYVRANAPSICGIDHPRVALAGYSSGAGAIAAFAAEYAEVRQILLFAPSVDVKSDVIERGLSQFGGEVYIVAGDDDPIVPSSQARWFYDVAARATRKRLVEIARCDHAFSGEYNQALVRHAPFWAFGDSAEFPPADLAFG